MNLLPFDPVLFVNTIFVAVIGSLFGGFWGAWLTHRFQKNRDDIAWDRRQEELQRQFKHDTELLRLEFQNKLDELNLQTVKENQTSMRESLLKGIDRPSDAIAELERTQARIRPRLPPIGTDRPVVEYALVLVIVPLIVIMVFALLGPIIGNIFSSIIQTVVTPSP